MAAPMNIENFLDDLNVPPNFCASKQLIYQFVAKQKENNHKIALVTSGGTTVPLESRTVRYIDNFSIGTRGSASAEYFLSKGYAVIFLHRKRSLTPFSRHFTSETFLGALHFQNNQICVNGENVPSLSSILKHYQLVQKEERLLLVGFQTIGEYLHLLHACCSQLKTFGSEALLYLAAAVSDFYIPKHELPEHKIQSSNGPLQIHLQMVPKMLGPLVKDWVPRAFVVSFKLETDSSLLISKSKHALEKYSHQLVIGNILETRKKEVILVQNNFDKTITLSEEQENAGQEIEDLIVTELCVFHNEFCDK